MWGDYFFLDAVDTIAQTAPPSGPAAGSDR